ncbi:MAG: hypothetical protein QOF06_2467 [Solirubrobacterales bacterium]|nr:hypothetical protein [Solirubrobacterales bacterium]
MIVRSAAGSLRNDIAAIEEGFEVEELPEQQMVELDEQMTQLAGGAASAFEGLIEEGFQTEAELLMIPLLSISRESSQAPIGAALKSMGEAGSREFNVAMARWLSHRDTQLLLELGSKLNGSSVGDGAGAELGEIAVRLWSEADGENGKRAQDALGILGELKAEGAGIAGERLAAQIREAFDSAPPPTEPQPWRSRLDRLGAFEKQDLIPSGMAADLEAQAVSRSLAQVPAADEAEMATQLVDVLARATERSSKPNLQDSKEALDASPWISAHSPHAQHLRLLISLGLATDDQPPQSPYGVDELVELAQMHKLSAIPVLALWLERFRPQPDEAARVIEPYSVGRHRLPPSLERAIDAYSERLDAEGRFRLVRGFLHQPLEKGRLRPAVLRQLGITSADPEQMTDSITQRYTKATTNPERETALAIWEAFAPSSAKHRKRLIQEVFVPLCGLNVGGYELCRKYLSLCKRPPRGTKEEILSALNHAPDLRRLKKMRHRMKEVGLRPLPKIEGQ